MNHKQIVPFLKSATASGETLYAEDFKDIEYAIDELRNIIIKYGDHKDDCKISDYQNCSCGWHEAFSSVAPKPPHISHSYKWSKIKAWKKGEGPRPTCTFCGGGSEDSDLDRLIGNA